jgi:hypothetical protein
MTDLTAFAAGDGDRPGFDHLRPSSLDKLVKCPVWSLLMVWADEDAGGPAAQTGSLTHEAVAAFHREAVESKKAQAGLDALSAGLPRFPLADPADARRHYALYAADPRNLTADVLAVELAVTLSLPPHPTDPTGRPVVVRGTLDQLRRVDGRVVVDDLKTGQPSGWEMVHSYAFQMAAYTLAARANGFPEAAPGRIIRTWGYRARAAVLPSPDGVFWHLPLTVARCEALMERVRLEVARVRAGEVHFGPGVHCTFCPHGGLDRCEPAVTGRLGLVAVA